MVFEPSNNNNYCYFTKRKGPRYSGFVLVSKFSYSKRYYHATAKREILPLIGVAILAIAGRYSYRAVMRMKEEWEEYEEDLKEYNARNSNAGGATSTKSYANNKSRGTNPLLPSLGISVGTSNARVSFLNIKNNNSPFIVENREGSRRTPSFVQLDYNDPIHTSNYSWGQMAKSKQYQQQNQVIISRPVLDFLSKNDNNLGKTEHESLLVAQHALKILVKELASSALQKKIGDLPTTKPNQKNQILFGELYYNVQPVITYPPAFDFNNKSSNSKSLFINGLEPFSQTSNHIKYVSEPLAAVVAADHFKLLPNSGNSDDVKEQPVLVLDIGGDGLNVSLIQNQQVLHHSYTPGIGVDTLITAIVNLCTRDFFTTKKQNVDGMALQLLNNAAEDALWELSSHPARQHRSIISIPYLSMDYQTKQPLHFSMGVTSHLVEEEATQIILTDMMREKNQNYITISDAISSILTDTLIKTMLTPFQLRGILLVGDGARSPIYQSSIKKGLARIAGENFVATKLIIPPNEQAEELTVLGAALIGESN